MYRHFSSQPEQQTCLKSLLLTANSDVRRPSSICYLIDGVVLGRIEWSEGRRKEWNDEEEARNKDEMMRKKQEGRSGTMRKMKQERESGMI